MSEPDLIRMTCPACAKKVGVKPELAGRRVRCPNRACGKSLDVPEPESDEEDETSSGRPLWPWLAGGGVLMLLLAALGVWALTRGGKPVPQPGGDKPVAVAPAKTAPAVAPAPVDDPEPEKKEPVKVAELPGAAGDRVAYQNKPADLRGVYLSAAEKLPKAGPEAPWNPYLPFGTKTLHLGVVFRKELPDVRIEVRLRSAAGEVKVAEGVPDWLTFNASTYVRFLTLTAPAAGWPDGPYQAEVRVDDTPVAVLNWSLVKEPPAVAKADPPKPAEVPVDKDLTYATVKSFPARHVGKRVVWPAYPRDLSDPLLTCAARPEDRTGNTFLPHLYCVVVAVDEGDRLRLAADLLRAENVTVTGTVAGEQTLEYEFGIPPDPKKRYKIVVPVLVNPVIRAGGQYLYGHSGSPVKWPDDRPAGARKLPGVDSPLAAAVAGGEPLVVPGKFSAPFIALSPDGKTLAVLHGGRESEKRTGVLTVLDARTGAERGKYPVPRFGYGLAYSPDGKTVAIGAEHPQQKAVNPPAECPVYLVDVSTGKVATTLPGNRATWTMGVESVAFSADGKTLASAARGDAVRLWDLATRTERRALKLEVFQFGRGLSPDGKWALTGDTETIRLLDTTTGTAGMEAKHPDWLEVAFSPAGPTLVTSSYKESDLRAWDTATGKERARAKLRDPASSPVYAVDGKWLYFLTSPKEGRKADLWVWDVTNAPPVHLRTLADESAGSVKLSADGSTLAVSTYPVTGARVRMWSTSAAPPPASTPTPDPTAPPAPAEDELLLLSAGPTDKSLSPALRYIGNDLQKALKAGNRLVDTTKTDAAVRVDPKNPKAGTIEWRGFEWRRGGAAEITNFGKSGITLAVHRKTPTTTDWELTAEAAQVVRDRLAKR